MKIYNIDWKKLVNNTLIISIRNQSNVAFIYSFIKPLELIHNQFKEFRSKSLYKVRHNSQIVYMEAVLNDEFDNDLRRIRIVNNEFDNILYLYEPLERREVFIYEPEDNKPVYLAEAYLNEEGVDFIVYVPPDLQPVEAELNAYLTKMRGLIDFYKLYSKNYKIEWALIEI